MAGPPLQSKASPLYEKRPVCSLAPPRGCPHSASGAAMTTNTVYLQWLPVQLGSFLVKATAFSVKHRLQPDVADPLSQELLLWKRRTTVCLQGPRALDDACGSRTMLSTQFFTDLKRVTVTSLVFNRFDFQPVQSFSQWTKSSPSTQLRGENRMVRTPDTAMPETISSTSQPMKVTLTKTLAADSTSYRPQPIAG